MRLASTLFPIILAGLAGCSDRIESIVESKARNAVRSVLRDPYTAKLVVHHVDRKRNAACGEVYSRAGFGGYGAARRFIYDAPHVFLEEGDPRAFEERVYLCRIAMNEDAVRWYRERGAPEAEIEQRMGSALTALHKADLMLEAVHDREAASSAGGMAGGRRAYFPPRAAYSENFLRYAPLGDALRHMQLAESGNADPDSRFLLAAER